MNPSYESGSGIRVRQACQESESKRQGSESGLQPGISVRDRNFRVQLKDPSQNCELAT